MSIVRRPAPSPGAPLASTPLISCLTITRGRPDFLRRCLASFDRQTWSRKELVVVVDRRGDLDWVEPFFEEHRRDDLRWAVPPAVEHLGRLRNISVEMARGDYVAIWDDDDWYHPARLEAQVRAALEEDVDACWLQDALHYFKDSGELFVVRWPLGLPPSLLCRRASMPRYTEVLDPEKGQKGSDTLLQRELLESRSNVLITESPFLYSYIFHGENVWPRGHHVHLAFGTTPGNSDVNRLTPGLRERLAEYYPEDPPGELVLRDGTRVPF